MTGKFQEHDLEVKPKEKERDRVIRKCKSKSLDKVLLGKFLTEYGYEKGEVAARAIVEDITETVKKYYTSTSVIEPGEIMWIAIDK